METAHLPRNPAWLDFGYFAEDGGYQAVQQMVRLEEDAPTAYYAANDLMAIGVLRALRERGIQVPNQVSVIGTNDAPEAAHVYPSLSTLRVPYAQMASKAAEILIQKIECAEVAPQQMYIEQCKLILRNSSGPCHERFL